MDRVFDITDAGGPGYPHWWLNLNQVVELYILHAAPVWELHLQFVTTQEAVFSYETEYDATDALATWVGRINAA
jgi:hypothetical protein